MAELIARNIESIRSEVKQLNAEIRSADSTLRALNKDIKLDPGNVDKVRQKFATLKTELSANEKLISTLKDRQQALNEKMKDAEGKNLKNYQKELVKTNEELKKAAERSAALSAAIANENKEISAAKWSGFADSVGKWEKAADKAAKTALVLGAALVALVKSSVDLGDELSDTSAKLNTSVEKLQEGRYIYEMLAAGADTYDSALSALSSSMTSIAKGRGKAYISTLRAIGLESSELLKLDTGEQLETITAALSKVTDETKRTQYAMALMGDAGRNVALIAAADSAEIDNYRAKLAQAGIITSEQASAADELANEFATVKTRLSAAGIELTVALIPAIEKVTELVENLSPIIEGGISILNSLGPVGQGVLLFLGTAIIMLPTVARLMKTVAAGMAELQLGAVGLSGAMATLQVASGWVGLILTAVAEVVLLLTSLFGSLKSSTDAAAESMSDFYAQYGAASDQLNASFTGSNQIITGTQNKSDINVNINARGEGDTAIGRENAEMIAELVADRVNNRLGELTYGTP